MCKLEPEVQKNAGDQDHISVQTAAYLLEEMDNGLLKVVYNKAW